MSIAIIKKVVKTPWIEIISIFGSLLCILIFFTTSELMITIGLLGVILGITIYVLLPISYLFGLLILACFYPLSFGNLGGINAFLWAEWMAPIFFVICLYYNRQLFSTTFPDHLLTFGIILLLSWAMINYLLNPVSAENLLGAGEAKGGIRPYYDIFVGTCIFLSAMWFGQQKDIEKLWSKYLKILLYFSLLLGCLRLLGNFMEFDIPGVYGAFSYKFSETGKYVAYLYAGEAYRIGGLSDAAGPGIAALVALNHGRPWRFSMFFLLSIFLFLTFMSGGRAFLIGLTISFLSYALLANRKIMRWVLLFSLLFSVLFILSTKMDVVSGQVSRLFALEGGIGQQDRFRGEAFKAYWDIFLQNPLLGKGIGHSKVPNNLFEFATEQLVAGGHGAYLSILSIFGLGGVIYLIIMLFGTLFKGYRYLWESSNFEPVSKIIVFITFFLSIRVFEYITGGTGYTDMTLYLLAGTMGAIISRKRIVNYG
jgi:hypothetical protein